MHERIQWTPDEAKLVDAMRARCLAFPEAVEVEQFGHPWFKAGKRPFCIAGRDEHVTFSFSTPKADQDTLCSMGLRPTPYMHQHGWVTLDVAEPDWQLVDDLLDSAYRNVAIKRMLAALDG